MDSTYLPFALPDIGEEEIAEVIDCLRSGWITTGPKVKALEERVAAYVGARHAVAVNSATAAMHLALEAAGTRPGDLIFVPAYTFTATAEVVRYFDAIPILIDSEPDTFNLSPAHLAQVLVELTTGRYRLGDGRVSLPPQPRLHAIIPVHFAGHPADMAPIYALAAQYGLAVIEDAAHALPSRYRGRQIGATPPGWDGPDAPLHATCFSFYATKTMTTAEGGMLVTDNAQVAERCRMMSLHGISKDAWNRYSATGSWYYEVLAPGYKYNLTDLAAALGLAQFAKLERMWARRQQIAAAYTEAFASLGDVVQTPVAHADIEHSWHLYVLRLARTGDMAEARAAFIRQLREAGIGASVHFIPLHLHPYYRETYGYCAEDFPVAYQEYQRSVSLPIYSRMTDADVARVIDAVCQIVGAGEWESVGALER
jgi:perosamine synthetase